MLRWRWWWRRRERQRREERLVGREKERGWSDFLGEKKKKSCIWGVFFVTFGFCFCHMSFISFEMGENGRLQDWRGAGPNNQVKYYFALGFTFHLNVTQNYMKVSLLFPLSSQFSHSSLKRVSFLLNVNLLKITFNKKILNKVVVFVSTKLVAKFCSKFNYVGPNKNLG